MKAINIKPKAHLRDGESQVLEVRMSRKDIGAFTVYDVEVRNKGTKSVAVDRIELFNLDLAVSKAEVFRQGFYMPGDPCGFYMLEAGKKPLEVGSKPDWCDAWDFVSRGLGVVSVPGNKEKLLIGFTTSRDFEGLLVLRTRGRTVKLTAWCNLEGISLRPGEWLRLEQFMAARSTDFNKCLDQYVTFTGEVNKARIPDTTVTGWVDWQYYRREKCEADILTNLYALKFMEQEGYPFQYVIVDGGWCDHDSEWFRPCRKFPSGMKKLSQIVRRNGLELGLWLAPYITNVKTEVVKKHPEWLVKDAKTGEPLYHPASNVGPCHVLDFTVSEALDWLRKIVRTMVREWKVAYIKLDGPALRHYKGGVFRNPDMTSIHMVRRSLEIIREECGNDILVEGEGMYVPSIGLVDIQRTTQDTWTCWYEPDTGMPAVKENMKNDLLSSFMHRKLWHNHRENVVIRDFPSPVHNRLKRNPLSKDVILPENELLFQISAAAMSGGAMLLSDPVDQLLRNPRKMELISQFLPHYESSSCCPLDTFCGGRQPSLYYLPVCRDFEQWYIIGVFNWDDVYNDYTVPLDSFAGKGTWHAFDFWDQEYRGRYKGELPVLNVPAHGCKILALRKALTHPQIVGTNMHILQGAVDIRSVSFENDVLEIIIDHFMQKERRITIWHPSRYKLDKVETNARDFLLDPRRKNLLAVQFNGKKRTKFNIKWKIK